MVAPYPVGKTEESKYKNSQSYRRIEEDLLVDTSLFLSGLTLKHGGHSYSTGKNIGGIALQ